MARDAIIGLLLPWLIIVLLAGFANPGLAYPVDFFDSTYLNVLGIFAIPLVLAVCSSILAAGPNNLAQFGFSERLKFLGLGAVIGVASGAMMSFFLVIGISDACVADSSACSGFTGGLVADVIGFGMLAIVYFVAAFFVRRGKRGTGGTSQSLHA